MSTKVLARVRSTRGTEFGGRTRYGTITMQGLGDRKQEDILLLKDGIALSIRKHIEPVESIARLRK